MNRLTLPFVAVLALAACDAGSAASGGGGGEEPIGGPESPGLPDVLATVAGEDLRSTDLPADALSQVRQMDMQYLQQRHDLVSDALDATIARRLLEMEAEARGVEVSDVVADEIGAIADPTDAEVEAWYGQNRARLQGRPLDQLREQIRDFLKTSRSEEAASELDSRLREKYGVTVNLDPFRVSLAEVDSPARGPSDAMVTLVEFSDFECPFCGRFFPTIKRIEQEYGDRIQIVYRQFPIPSLHPAAFKAAEASLCAHEQGEFWEYHDLLFQEQDRLAVRDLKEKAGRLGLDQGDFDGCLDSGRYVERVQNDIAAGEAVGVSGTPALFVNGIPIPGGAVAFEVVAEVLDAELARVGG